MSSSLVQSVMSMASSHSQHSHISTDTMSSMSGSYLAAVDGQPAGGDGGDVMGEEVLVEEGEEEGEEEEEEQQDALMESRGPSQQDGVRSSGDKIFFWLWSRHQLILFIPLEFFPYPGVCRGA